MSAVTHLKIVLGDKVLDMTADEAREVYGQLRLLFAQSNERPLIVPYPVYPPAPVYVPQPIMWEPHPWPKPYEITYIGDDPRYVGPTSDVFQHTTLCITR